MKFDPRHLEVLATVVDEGGVTEAARALGKSQPSLSRTISMVEARLGAPLFEPGRRPLRPTELGLALADQGRRIRTALAAAGDLVEGHRRGTSGTVRIGGTPFFMDGVISAQIAEFQMQNPRIGIEQINGYAEDLLSRLEDDRLDLAVLPVRAGTLPDWVAAKPILPGRNVIACRDGHPLTRAVNITLADITRYPWISPPAESPLHRDMVQLLKRLGADDLRMSFSGGTLASIATILSESDALSILPFSVVYQLRKRSGLAAIPLRLDHPDRVLSLLRVGANRPGPAAQNFEAHIVRKMALLTEAVKRHEQESMWRK